MLSAFGGLGAAGLQDSPQALPGDTDFMAKAGDPLTGRKAGFEVRDVESLREHYSETLHAWLTNLESSWDEAVALVGEPRARVWRLYMAGSANGFDDGGIAVHQVLGVVPAQGGASGMPRARTGWG